ncbi:tyrosine-type recombinase/integrase [Nocardia sp. NPDC060249]|uniref:tyrosine-type recombinase/integrase n=1 Tax=Nocardia sp. NPDC060249 TaxID=3347082 RepID=UPI003667EC8C
MSHIKDQWWGEEPDPDNPKKKIRFKKPDFGKGMRYKVVWIPPGSKREKSKSFPDGKKKLAEEFQTYIDNSILDRKYVDPKAGQKLFPEVSKAWLRTTSSLARSRAAQESVIGNCLDAFFEDCSIESAARLEAVVDWSEWMGARTWGGRPLSPSYRLQAFSALSSIFAFAMAERLILENPCKAKNAPRPKLPKTLYIPWARERLNAVEAGLDERLRLVVPMGAASGMRLGEILGFSPDDVDRRAMMLSVARQTKRLTGGTVFALPKGSKTRQVPLSKWQLRRIDQHVEQFPPVSVTLPWDTLDGDATTVRLSIVRPDDEPWYASRFLEGPWAKAFEAAGLEQRRQLDGVHALRHVYASQQLAGSVSVKELGDALGHEDPSITLNTYTHLLPSSAPRSRWATDMYFDPDSAGTAPARPEFEIVDDGSAEVE